MFESVEILESHVRDSLQESIRFYSKQSWVAPAVTRSGQKIHDVIIVGAGQNGLALAYNLKLRGVRRIVVVDAQDRDKPGPWSSFARMSRLRTPKSIPGPDCSNPLLTFKAWFCSAYSVAEYDSFEFIPLKYWREYLAWYRSVLEIETVNNTTVTGIEWDAEDGCLQLRVEGPDHPDGVPAAPEGGSLAARKLCLATGMTAAGQWAAPAALAERLPREAYLCAWEEIPWPELAGEDIAVIGAGASGFDNASWAVDAGSRSVTVISRSPFPKRDLYFELWYGRDDSGLFSDEADSPPADFLDPLVAYNADLNDRDRLRLIAAMFKKGRSPVNPEYLARAKNLDRMRVLEGWPIDHIDYLRDTRRVRIRGNGEELTADRVIFATGPQGGMQYRPELRQMLAKTLTWGDGRDSGDPAVREMGTYPKLSAHYQLQPKEGGGAELANIYCLADLVHNTVGLHSLQHVVTTVARHIASSFYQEQFPGNISLIEDLVDR